MLYGWSDSMSGFRVQNSWGTGSGDWPTGLGWISYSAVTNLYPTPSRYLMGYYLTFDKPIFGRLKRLTYNTANELACSISDGRFLTSWGGAPVAKVAFITEHYGTPYPGVTGELCVINRDGTGFTRLTWGGRASQPSMSASGKMVAFIWGTGNSAELYLMKTDGTWSKRVTYNSVPESQPSLGWGGTPGWGEIVAFISGSGNAAELYWYGQGWSPPLKRLTWNAVPESDPCLTRFGEAVVFISRSGTAAEVFYVDVVDSNPVKRLTYNAVQDSSPTISYYGDFYGPFLGYNSRIAFKSGTDLYAINSDGTQLTRLTWGDAEEYYPRISQDGNTVTFVVNNEVYDMITWGGGYLNRLTYNAYIETCTDTNYYGDLVACLTYALTGTTKELVVFYGPATPY